MLEDGSERAVHAGRHVPGPLHCSFLYPVDLLAGWISFGLARFMLLALKRRVLWLEYGLKLKEPPMEDDHGHGL